VKSLKWKEKKKDAQGEKKMKLQDDGKYLQTLDTPSAVVGV
jgi:hypothetical protein